MEVFFLSLAKIQILYYIGNQFIIKFYSFYDSPYYTKEATSVADVKGVITGYNGETKSGEVKFVMADKASGTVQSGWETLDLSSLGTVTSMTFTVESEDTMCPYYFAIDNLAYEK